MRISKEQQHNDNNDVQEEHILRGKLGPGHWHCYTAIFDEKNSVIRIDGRNETGSDDNMGKDQRIAHTIANNNNSNDTPADSLIRG
eukprot:CAMPEP_0197830664 /NCGR_PEP_ID=MMETSP1437-20131217/7284_1 /TAXON_ID=49252 ORGANISM="Eucampia antarctica, Strain CCMP1452" /NCGR_SAMPLE_ID=MMETSP1437 /ASSEMBLY_ACC=CAM_ASM_001096 /LENGTH=85 /DNA_ID=CAMNT_0043433207 /DNA_START=42 /DNA_END=296 /DNA_ORIENTATION=+